jgi:pyruvate kinase
MNSANKFANSPFSVSRQPRLNRTKTVATVGPASKSMETLVQLVEAGVDVFRLNMAHGCRSDHMAAVEDIREAGRRCNYPVGILIDLAGPKIRLGQIPEESRTLESGTLVYFVDGDSASGNDELTCSYPNLASEVVAGDRIMIGDAMVRLQVESSDGRRVACRVMDGGIVRSRQGVNLPGVNLGVPALLPEDIDNALWAATIDAEFVSLSFVRRASEIVDLKTRLRQGGSLAMVIAKIEKREALEQLDEIVEVADAVMVARGDLGVEIEIEKTPLAQKRIIRTCGRYGKPVIVATQMLESMHSNRFPTRAEVSDVANAILDGADACMLSGETAIGLFPVEAVKMMRRIQVETESTLQGRPSRDFAHGNERVRKGDGAVTEAVMMAAAMLARRADARLVVIASSSAEAAILKSKQRDFIPTIAVTDQAKVVNRMCLLWGISPLLVETIQLEELRERLCQWAAGNQDLHSGDRVVFVADTALWPGIHDTVMIWSIP